MDVSRVEQHNIRRADDSRGGRVGHGMAAAASTNGNAYPLVGQKYLDHQVRAQAQPRSYAVLPPPGTSADASALLLENQSKS